MSACPNLCCAPTLAVYQCFGCNRRVVRKSEWDRLAALPFPTPIRRVMVEDLCDGKCSENVATGRFPWDDGPKPRKKRVAA